MAEEVDATDLKSVGPYGPCGFESRSRYRRYPYERLKNDILIVLGLFGFWAFLPPEMQDIAGSCDNFGKISETERPFPKVCFNHACLAVRSARRGAGLQRR